MSRPLKIHVPVVPVSYSIPDAAIASGITAAQLNKAIEDDELEVHYLGQRKRVVMADELKRYVSSKPTSAEEVA